MQHPEQRDPEALDHQLLDQPPPAGAERHADGHLPAPDGRASEQQARDVRAGEGENQPDGHEQQPEERADGGEAPELFGRPDRREQRDVAEPAPSRLRHGLAGGRERRPGRGQCLIVPQAADELNGRDRTGGVEVRHQRPADRQIDFRRQPESRNRPCTFGNYSHHRVGTAVEDQRAADDRGRAAQPLLPEPMADHDDGRIELCLPLPRREPAAERHRHADHVEEVAGDGHRD